MPQPPLALYVTQQQAASTNTILTGNVWQHVALDITQTVPPTAFSATVHVPFALVQISPHSVSPVTVAITKVL